MYHADEDPREAAPQGRARFAGARALSNTTARARPAGPEAAPGPPSEGEGPPCERAGRPGGDALSGWAQALAAFAAALGAYADETGAAGRRAYGPRWEAALSAVRAAGDARPAARAAPSLEGAALYAAHMDDSDALEEAAGQLEQAARVLLSPDVSAAVSAGMSRTFSDKIGGLRRRVGAAAGAAAAAAREALQGAAASGAALAAGLPVAAVAGAYAPPAGLRGPRGAVATELYVGALACLRSPEARALLEASRAEALGGRADTPAAAAADTAALAEYHPCQAMCYAPAFVRPRPRGAGPGLEALEPRSPEAPEPASGPGLGPPFDLSFPQARLAVAYDLAPLVDRRRASEFGPLASTTSGLNYRLVERLRTISAVPAPARAPAAPAPRPVAVAGPIAVSPAPGVVWESGPPGPLGSEAGGPEWAPFAGAQPRAGLYAEACAAVILDRLRAERAAGWGPALLAQYEAAARGGALPDPPVDPGLLVDALAAEFEKAYDAAPPDDPAAFRALVVPLAPAPRDYISAAVARLAGGALDARLRAHLAEAGPRVPYAPFEREARVSQAVLVADVSRELWRRLRGAYRGDDEAFAPHPVRRKALLLSHFRRIAAAAAAAAPVHVAPPSLKLWAAAGGASGFEAAPYAPEPGGAQ